MKTSNNLAEAYFALGCFHFGVNNTPPYLFNKSKYLKNLKDLLSSIPGITNIQIDDYKNISLNQPYHSIKILDQIPEIDEGEGYFPQFTYLTWSFNITIPFHTQLKLFKKMPFSQRVLPTETFLVTTNYGYNDPITIIEPIKPTNHNFSASDSIILVREYLYEEIKKFKKFHLRLEVLGPSPMHAEFEVRRGVVSTKNTMPWKIQTQVIPDPGYSKVIINYNPNYFSNMTDVMNHIHYVLLIEGSYYYFLASTRSLMINKWYRIRTELNEFIKIQQKPNLINYFKKIFCSQNKINSLILSLTNFETTSAEIEDEINEQRENVFNKSQGNILEFICNSDYSKRPHYATDVTRSLISTYSDQQTNRFQNLITLISAFIGGIVGSVLTLFATK